MVVVSTSVVVVASWPMAVEVVVDEGFASSDFSVVVAATVVVVGSAAEDVVGFADLVVGVDSTVDVVSGFMVVSISPVSAFVAAFASSFSAVVGFVVVVVVLGVASCCLSSFLLVGSSFGVSFFFSALSVSFSFFGLGFGWLGFLVGFFCGFGLDFFVLVVSSPRPRNCRRLWRQVSGATTTAAALSPCAG